MARKGPISIPYLLAPDWKGPPTSRLGRQSRHSDAPKLYTRESSPPLGIDGKPIIWTDCVTKSAPKAQYSGCHSRVRPSGVAGGHWGGHARRTGDRPVARGLGAERWERVSAPKNGTWSRLPVRAHPTTSDANRLCVLFVKRGIFASSARRYGKTGHPTTVANQICEPSYWLATYQSNRIIWRWFAGGSHFSIGRPYHCTGFCRRFGNTDRARVWPAKREASKINLKRVWVDNVESFWLSLRLSSYDPQVACGIVWKK